MGKFQRLYEPDKQATERVFLLINLKGCSMTL